MMDKLWSLQEIISQNLYCRGAILALYAIILFRASSSRLYGNLSPLDFVIYIIIGETLGETIMNDSPLISTMIVCALIVVIHNFLSYLCYRSHKMGLFIKGRKISIIRNGRYLEKNLRGCRLSHNDVLQSLRIQHGIKKINDIVEASLERDGQISFILKK